MLFLRQISWATYSMLVYGVIKADIICFLVGDLRGLLERLSWNSKGSKSLDISGRIKLK